MVTSRVLISFIAFVARRRNFPQSSPPTEIHLKLNSNKCCHDFKKCINIRGANSTNGK